METWKRIPAYWPNILNAACKQGQKFSSRQVQIIRLAARSNKRFLRPDHNGNRWKSHPNGNAFRGAFQNLITPILSPKNNPK